MTENTEHLGKLRFLLRSAASLASTTVVTAALGFVYWAVAARAFSATAVGESSTAIAAMSLIAPLTLLGFGTLLMAELPSMSEGRSTVVSTAGLLTGTVAGLVALACAAVLPSDFLGLPGIDHRPGVALLFAAMVATQSVGLLLDQALLSMLGGGMQLRRNVAQALVKLALLVVLTFTLSRWGSLTIIASWLAGNVVSILAITVWLVRTHKVPLGRLVPSPSALRGMHFDAIRHHALNTALLVPYFAMPIIANVILGSERAGYLYAAWSIAGFVFFAPLSLATALFASGARDSATFHLEFRKTLRYSLLICLAATAAIAVFGHLVLAIFGKSYAANAYVALVILCIGGLGLVIKDHHVALARVKGNVAREAVIVAVLSLVEVLGAVLGAARGGLTGLTLGWLCAVAVGVVFYSPQVWQEYRRVVPGVDS